MERFEIEDQIQLTYIFEQPVKGLDKDLDEVEKSEGRLCGCTNEDKVEGSIMSVCYEGGCVIVGGSGADLGIRWRGGSEERRESRYHVSLKRSNKAVEEISYGRKLQADAGRCETRVNLSDISRC